MKYRSVLIILLVLVLTGCAVDQQTTPPTDDGNPDSESTDTTIINAERIEQLKNYIDENAVFTDLLTQNIVACTAAYGTNYAPLTYELNYDATSITIRAQNVLPNSGDPDINTMVIWLDENNNIQYKYAYIYYKAFEYYRGGKLEHYQAHLKYYHDSDGNRWLKLNCYWQYFYQLQYDQTNDCFVNADPTSDGYAQKMVFKDSLTDGLNSSYSMIMYNTKIFEAGLDALGAYAKTLFTPQ